MWFDVVRSSLGAVGGAVGGLRGSGGAVKASKNENARTEWNPLGL